VGGEKPLPSCDSGGTVEGGLGHETKGMKKKHKNYATCLQGTIEDGETEGRGRRGASQARGFSEGGGTADKNARGQKGEREAADGLTE